MAPNLVPDALARGFKKLSRKKGRKTPRSAPHARVERKSDDDATSVEFFSTTATADNLPGAGRTLAKYFFQPLGLRAELLLSKIVSPWLLDPIAIGRKMLKGLLGRSGLMFFNGHPLPLTYQWQPGAEDVITNTYGKPILAGLRKLTNALTSRLSLRRTAALMELVLLLLCNGDILGYLQEVFSNHQFLGRLTRSSLKGSANESMDKLNESLIRFIHTMYSVGHSRDVYSLSEILRRLLLESPKDRSVLDEFASNRFFMLHYKNAICSLAHAFDITSIYLQSVKSRFLQRDATSAKQYRQLAYLSFVVLLRHLRSCSDQLSEFLTGCRNALYHQCWLALEILISESLRVLSLGDEGNPITPFHQQIIGTTVNHIPEFEFNRPIDHLDVSSINDTINYKTNVSNGLTVNRITDYSLVGGDSPYADTFISDVIKFLRTTLFPCTCELDYILQLHPFRKYRHLQLRGGQFKKGSRYIHGVRIERLSASPEELELAILEVYNCPKLQSTKLSRSTRVRENVAHPASAKKHQVLPSHSKEVEPVVDQHKDPGNRLEGRKSSFQSGYMVATALHSIVLQNVLQQASQAQNPDSDKVERDEQKASVVQDAVPAEGQGDTISIVSLDWIGVRTV